MASLRDGECGCDRCERGGSTDNSRSGAHAEKRRRTEGKRSRHDPGIPSPLSPFLVLVENALATPCQLPSEFRCLTSGPSGRNSTNRPERKNRSCE